MKQCEGCDNQFSGRYEFATGYCREYENETDVPERCQRYVPTPCSRYVNEIIDTVQE
jgi:hypothetical protein